MQKLKLSQQKTNLNKPEFSSSGKVRDTLPVLDVPENERWRLGMTSALMKIKKESI